MDSLVISFVCIRRGAAYFVRIGHGLAITPTRTLSAVPRWKARN